MTDSTGPGPGDDRGVPAAPIIVTKIRPPRRRRDLLSRQRLIDYISDNIDRKMLLVSAPAGYGKTSLLVDFVDASDFPVCWYRLDAADADPAVFFEHLLAAIQQQYPDAGQRTLAALRQSGRIDIDAVVATLVNEIDAQIADFFLLALDDYQNVDDSLPVNRAVDTLLVYLPDNCQLIVSSRTLPTKLTLTRLAGEGQVAGVGQEQLRFTPSEIRELVAHLHGKTLSEMESERLARESEGWITALVLGSERLLDGLRLGMARPASDKVRLFDFLAREVYEELPPDVRSFLCGSAVLDAMTPDLCDAVLERGDSAEVLHWLEDHNLFLMRIEGDGDWYRYHQLFLEFLRARLATETPNQVPGMHRRAAAWFAAVGLADLEIAHLLDAGDAEGAATRMDEEAGAAHTQGRWRTIVRWAESLPDPTLLSHPGLLRHAGLAYSYEGDMAASVAALGAALDQFERAGDDEGMATVLVTRAVVWRLMGQIDNALEDGRRALELTRDPNGRTAGMAHRSLGGSYVIRGEMAPAAEALQQALACFEDHGAMVSAAHTHTDLSAMYQMSGNIEQSIAHSRAARDLHEGLGNFGAAALALNNLGTAYHQQGRFEDARRVLEEAVEKARVSGFRRTEAMALTSIGDVISDLDEFALAIDHYERGLTGARAVRDSALVCYALAACAETYRLRGDLIESRNLVAQARQELVEHRSAFEAALVDYVRGTLALDCREYDRATDHLEDAAQAFGQLGARREEARALIYRAAAGRSAGEEGGGSSWRRRAEEIIAAFGYPESFAPYLTRVPVRSAPPQPAADVREAPTVPVAVPEVVPGLTVQVLGPPIVCRNGEPLDRKAWQTLTARDLFLYLVDRPGGLSRDDLMVAFWPDSPDVRARSSLHSTLYRVRRALGDKQIVQVDFERYFVKRPGDLVYDLEVFEAHLTRAADAIDDEARLEALEAATGLVRGDYLEGVSDEWCQARRREIEARFADALLSLAEVHGRLRQWDAAIEGYLRVLEIDKLRGAAQRGLIAALSSNGDRVRALRQFEAYERMLDIELGARPDAQTRDLYQQIRDGGVGRTTPG